MPKEVRLPQLGQTMEEGTIVGFNVKPGDEVNKGDVIFEVETDKATLEVESPAAGFVKHILLEVAQTVPVNTPVLILGEKDEQVSQDFIDSLRQDTDTSGPTAAAEQPPAPQQQHPAVPSDTPKPAAEPAVPQTVVSKPLGRIFASPRAKIAAAELGVDLAKVLGTGGNGRIVESDVRNAATAPAKQAMPEPIHKLGEKVPITRMQRIVAERMLKSKHEIPCFYLNAKADVTELFDLRTKLNKHSDLKIAFNDFIMLAMARALKQYPIMTGQVAGEYIQLADSINIGLAIAVPDGLVAPTVKDVDRKNLTQIAADSKTLIEKARSNKLSPADLTGGCITLSNLGAFGVESFTPIVVPGQCSILGIGRIIDTSVPVDGNLMVRKLMALTLSVDHSVANGAYAAQFLDFLRKLLQDTGTFA